MEFVVGGYECVSGSMARSLENTSIGKYRKRSKTSFAIAMLMLSDYCRLIHWYLSQLGFGRFSENSEIIELDVGGSATYYNVDLFRWKMDYNRPIAISRSDFAAVLAFMLATKDAMRGLALCVLSQPIAEEITEHLYVCDANAVYKLLRAGI
jgi:hypothetical protein